ncbi:8-amino-7-oxononanoate synthase [bacterium (Candidatus Howlettbacteria) CG_4_10_14_3_um_filter_37_10]|nr:MAG: 8-amino-7-oxononanoate synthase [bacterium (Candidatus Howlettbacteria) CG23_combo_of_CG06-09_8_20_14_all_37_9]PIY00349.1 MAG: 8-amino-7-oxononanoate synthase [bacterium (Candidatus Howlettbacteria) CG_4_10_14_3_um_filter_37_10]
MNQKFVLKYITSKTFAKKSKNGLGEIEHFLDFAMKEGIYPDFHFIDEGATEPEVVIEGKKMLMFASNNYLGLAKNRNVIQAAEEALKKHGLGPCGSRMLAGNLKMHRDLEDMVAKLVEKEDVIIYATGYMANSGGIPALVDPMMASAPFKEGSSAIFSDKLNHATIIDGSRLSHAEKIIFEHKNCSDLEDKLKKSKHKNKMIVTDGVFSMDGDVAPLPQIAEIAKKYGAFVMVDDAHATGVLGSKGGGTAEHFNITKDIDLIMGTFNKGLGGMGGFIAGPKKVVDYLRVASRSYIFSLALPAVITAGVMAAIKEANNHPEYRKRVLANGKYLSEGLKNLGFEVFGENTPINPVFIGEEVKGIDFARKLAEDGIFAPCVRWPAVEEGKARIRLVVTASHEKKHLDKLISSFNKIGKELRII